MTINKADLEMLRKNLAVKAVKKSKKKRIPKGDISKYTRVSFNDYIAVNRLLELVDDDVILERLGSAEDSDDLISLMAVEYIMKNAPTKEITQRISDAVKNGADIAEITQYACKEMSKSVDERKFEEMLDQFVEESRVRINRQIISQIQDNRLKQKLKETTNSDELAALYISNWLIGKFKKTDPDLEKIMINTIENTKDFKKVAETAMLKYYDSKPSEARTADLAEFEKQAVARLKKEIYEKKQAELGGTRFYTLGQMIFRAIAWGGFLASVISLVTYTHFSSKAEEYFSKNWERLPVKTEFDSNLRRIMKTDAVLEDLLASVPLTLPRGSAEVQEEYQQIVAMEELSGSPRKPDADLIVKKMQALQNFALEHGNTAHGYAALEKASLMSYINRDVVKADPVSILDQMLVEYARFDVLSEENLGNIITRFYKLQEQSLKSNPQGESAAVLTIKWLESVREKTKTSHLSNELSYYIACLYDRNHDAQINNQNLKDIFTILRDNNTAHKSQQDIMRLYEESMKGSYSRAVRASFLIAQYHESKKDPASMIEWYKKTVGYHERAVKRESGYVAPPFVAQAYICLGKGYLEAKYYEQANEMFEKAITINPALSKQIQNLKVDPESKRSSDFWETW